MKVLITQKELKKLYEIEQLSQYKIAQLNGCSQAEISLLCSKWNIKVRSRTLPNSRNPFWGRHHTEETKQKISKANKGNTYRRGKSQPQTAGDRNPSQRPEIRLKISRNRRGISTGNGAKNNNWRGGRSFEPYNRAFYKMRSFVLERDNYQCQGCGRNNHLSLHHQDEDKRNAAIDNLLTLCFSCHAQLHWDNWKGVMPL